MVTAPEVARAIADRLPLISAAGFPVAAEPVVLPQREYEDLLTATARLLELQREIVVRLASDRDGRLNALRADRSAMPRFVDDEDFELQHAIDMARADVVITAEGPRFIEFNVGGGFGGMVQFEVQRRIWRDHADPGLLGTDPYAAFAALIARTAQEHDVLPEPVFLTSFADSGRTEEELRTQVSLLAEHGINATFVDFRHLPAVPRNRVAVVQFSEREARDEGWDMASVLSLSDARTVGIPSQSSRLIDSKKVLALLSEEPGWLSEEDRDLVRRFVPWTRIVRADLRDQLLDDPSRFVLKGSAGLSGKEVHFGAHCTTAEWRQLVASAVRSEYYVAQEVMKSVTVRLKVMRDGAGHEDMVTAQMVVSPFCIGGVPTGCHVRLSPSLEIGLVTRPTGAFPGCLLGAPT